MMARLAGLIIALALYAITTASAQEEVSNSDRFGLWNNCESLDIIVSDLHEDAAEIGLTSDQIITTVRSRFRAARIYDPAAITYLYVNVNVFSTAFNLSISYKKALLDPGLNKTGYATTWTIGSVGTHGGNANYILGTLSLTVDEFIDEYFRVNADACQ